MAYMRDASGKRLDDITVLDQQSGDIRYAYKNAITVAELEANASPENPIVIAHRGAGSTLAPENTREAFKLGLSFGFGCMEGGDLFPLAGTQSDLAVCHDATVDTFTTASGNVDTFSPIAWRNLTVDCENWFGGQYKNTNPITFDDVCREFGGKAVLVPEAKRPEAAPTLIRVVERYGLQASVIAQSFYKSVLTSFVEAGMEAMYLWNQIETFGTTERQALLSDGVRWVGLSSAVSDQVITDCVNDGLNVVVYGVNRQWEREHYASLGVIAYFSDNPVYFEGKTEKYRLTSNLFTGGDFYHGHIPASGGDGSLLESSRGVMVAPDKFKFPTGYTARTVLLGGLSPVANDNNWTMNFSFDMVAVSQDATRYVALHFTDTDRLFSESNDQSGITLVMRNNGFMAWFFRPGDGSITQVGSLNSGSQVAGQTVTFNITHATNGTMTVSRTDAGASTTAAVDMNSAAARSYAAKQLYVHIGRTDAGTGGTHDVVFRSPTITT